MRPCGLGFLYQRFSSLLGDEACQFRNQQSRTVVHLATIVLSGWATQAFGLLSGTTRPGCVHVKSKPKLICDALGDKIPWRSSKRRVRQRYTETRPSLTKRNKTGKNGGEGGIRTHGRVSPTHAFQACSLNRSDTSPRRHAFSSVTKGGQSGKRRCEAARGAKQIQRMSATISSTNPG
jgi:hypothetical protein